MNTSQNTNGDTVPIRRGALQFLLHWLRIFITLGLIATLAVYIAFYKYTGITLDTCWREAQKIVDSSSIEDFNANLTTRFYTDDGKLLAKLSRDKSNLSLKYDEIPEDVVNAFVAVEDRSYWTNPGIDLKGIVRAVYVALKNHGATQGASTITQQMVRSIYLSNERSILRKVREIMIALQLTQSYSKEEIMAAYVNGCCFANNIYGIHDAAKAYFGKSESECSLAEIAYLCAIPNRPEYFNPWRDETAAKERQEKILRDMRDAGYISERACKKAAKEKLKVIPKQYLDQYNFATTYAIKCATEALMERDGFKFRYSFKTDDDYEEYKQAYDEAYSKANEDLYTGGYSIETTLNTKRQDELQELINAKMKKISRKRDKDRLFTLQTSVTVVDNNTHKVTAIIGGRTQTATRGMYAFNRAFQAKRQPGSSIKPLIVYTPALMAGYTDESVLKNVDVDEAYENPKSVRDLDGDRVMLRDAVVHSLNGCALYLFSDIGPASGLKYLSKMDFSSIVPSDRNLSAALGGLTHGTNTLEMANAYSTLANRGYFTRADCIDSIITAEGEEIYEEKDPRRVYDTEAVELMTDIMRGVLEEGGTAAKMNWYDYTSVPAAGKTGTTNSSTDGWFCGFTDDYTTAVWVGNDDSSPVDDLYGGTHPAEIWRDVMLKIMGVDTKKQVYHDDESEHDGDDDDSHNDREEDGE